MAENYYQILGVSPDCSQEEIKKAYRRLARCSHPDACGTNDSTQFRKITEAYENINTASKRKAYDEKLRREQEEAAQRARVSRMDHPIGDRYSFSVIDEFDRIIDSLFFPQFHGLNPQLDLIITEQEAKNGVTVPITIPVHEACPICEELFWGSFPFCDYCHGTGYVDRNIHVTLQIPPNIRNNSRMKVTVPGIGILTIAIFIE